MDDVRDLLESEELKKAVEAVQNLERKWGSIGTSQLDGKFRNIVLPRFQAPKVLQALTDSSPGYPGQKDVFAAGFAAWVLFPTKPEVRNVWMTHAILTHLDEAERAVGLLTETWTLGRDIAARYVFGGSIFLEEIYNEMGGYEGLGRSSPQEILDAIHDTDVRMVRTVARAMAYLHHGIVMQEAAGQFHRPSVNRAVEILDKVRAGELRTRRHVPEGKVSKRHAFVGRSLLHKRWGEGKGTIALIYAASRLQISKRRTLLDDMLDGVFSHREHGRLIPKWLGMTRYASETILLAMEDHSQLRATARTIGDCDRVTIMPPTLTALEKREVLSGFHKRK